MRTTNVRTAVGIVVFNLCIAATAAAQVMDKVEYFQDSIAEKGDLNHIIRLSGGSSWVLSEATMAPVASAMRRNARLRSAPQPRTNLGGARTEVAHAARVFNNGLRQRE